MKSKPEPSAFLRFLTGYSRHESSLHDGLLLPPRGKEGKTDRGSAVSVLLNRNPIVRLLTYLATCFFHTPARGYGLFMIPFGLGAVLAYFFAAPLGARVVAGDSFLIVGGGAILLGIALLLSGEALCTAVQRSHLLSFALYDFFAVRKHNADPTAPRFPVPGFLILGFIAGAGCFLVSPLWFVGILGGGVLLMLAFSSCECALMLVTTALPFLALTAHPTVWLCVWTLVCASSYLFKVLLNKRTFAFEPLDFYVLLLMLVYAGTTAFTWNAAGRKEGAVMLCLLLIYFVASNLLSNPAVAHRLTRALIVSATLAALIGIIQYFSGRAVQDWLDSTVFRDIAGRITAFFGNPNVLAAYLLAVIPFAFLHLSSARKVPSILFYLLAMGLLLGALILTWSRGAWLALLLILPIVLVFTLKRSPMVVAGVCLLLPYAAMALPQNVLHRWGSIGAAMDSSISYRLSVWRSSLRLLFDHPFGVGSGSSSFTAVFPAYAESGAETVLHAHNLYMEIAAEMGWLGLVLFFVVIAVLFQMVCSHQLTRRAFSMRVFSCTAFAAVLALLICGATDYVWYNPRIFFVFWLIMGLCRGGCRAGRTEHARERSMQFAEKTTDHADADFPLYRIK